MDDPGGTTSVDFPWYEYAIFSVSLLISLSIGIYNALSGDKSTSQYLMANRQLGILPVSLSMFMSFISTITVLGNAAEMYTFGIGQWWFTVGNCIGFTLAALLFVPLFYPLNITSSFEYLEMRYQSKAVKFTGDFLLMVYQIIYMGIAMFSPAQALQSVTPIPQWASMIALGVICTIYTSIGGVRAVAWTDVFQGFIMFAGVLIVVILGTEKAGGVDELWQRAEDSGRLHTDLTLDPLVRVNIWAVITNGMVMALAWNGSGQTSIQRYCAMPSMRQAKIATLLSIPLIIVANTLTYWSGFAIFAYYDSVGCDILRTPDIDNQNQILVFFILNVLRVPVVPGLFVAVIFSASLSSMSSSMNSLSACTWKDMIEPCIPGMSETRKAIIVRCLSAVYGCLAIGCAFLMANVPGSLIQIASALLGGVSGPLLGLFCLAAFFPCTNWIGAVVGALLGFVVNVVVVLGNTLAFPYREYNEISTDNCYSLGYEEIDPMPEDPDGVFDLFRVSFTLFGILGVVVTLIIGLIASFLGNCLAKKPLQKEVHPALVVPVFDRIACCLPSQWLSKCWCDVPYDEVQLDDRGVLVSPALPALNKIQEELCKGEMLSDLQANQTTQEEIKVDCFKDEPGRVNPTASELVDDVDVQQPHVYGKYRKQTDKDYNKSYISMNVDCYNKGYEPDDVDNQNSHF